MRINSCNIDPWRKLVITRHRLNNLLPCTAMLSNCFHHETYIVLRPETRKPIEASWAIKGLWGPYLIYVTPVGKQWHTGNGSLLIRKRKDSSMKQEQNKKQWTLGCLKIVDLFHVNSMKHKRFKAGTILSQFYYTAWFASWYTGTLQCTKNVNF